jgi:hypothetical protein
LYKACSGEPASAAAGTGSCATSSSAREQGSTTARAEQGAFLRKDLRNESILPLLSMNSQLGDEARSKLTPNEDTISCWPRAAPAASRQQRRHDRLLRRAPAVRVEARPLLLP